MDMLFGVSGHCLAQDAGAGGGRVFFLPGAEGCAGLVEDGLHKDHFADGIILQWRLFRWNYQNVKCPAAIDRPCRYRPNRLKAVDFQVARHSFSFLQALMIYLLKISLTLFLIAWCVFGMWLIVRYARLFGPHADDPAESPGARSFGVTHVGIVWFGFFALAGYFLFR